MTPSQPPVLPSSRPPVPSATPLASGSRRAESLSPQARLRVAVLFAAALFYALFIARTGFTIDGEWFFSLRDDAMISMRYARNLADGYGLVWDPGQQPVEGYTNFLWTLWMAVIHLLPITVAKTSLVVAVSGGAILLGLAAVVGRIGNRVGGPTAGLVAMILTAFFYPMVFWTLRGMEVGLLALLVYLAVDRFLEWYHTRDRRPVIHMAVLLSLALLTRPDAVVAVGVIVMAMIVVIRRDSGVAGQPGSRTGGPIQPSSHPAIQLSSHPAIQPAIVIGAAFVTIALHSAFRLWYYGDLLPNTYYLKLHGIPLWDRLARGWTTIVPIMASHLALLIVAALATLRRVRRPQYLVLWLMFGSHVLYSIYVGGDAWEFFGFANRYVTIGAPALILLACFGVVQSVREVGERWSLPLVAMFGVQTVLTVVVWIGNYFWWYRSVVTSVWLLVFGSVVASRLPNVSLLTSAEPRVHPRIGVRSYRLTLLLALTALWAGSNARSVVGEWIPSRGAGVDGDNTWAMYGYRLGRATAPDFELGVVAAGNISYFAHRPTEDLLGKSDPVIARSDPRGEFSPGHNRWDYAHTVNVQRPDALVFLWNPDTEALALLRGAGYVDVFDMVSGQHDRPCFDRIDGRWLGCQCGGAGSEGLICGLWIRRASAGSIDLADLVGRWLEGP